MSEISGKLKMNRRADICIMSSGRNVNDERIYYKIARTLRALKKNIAIVAPGEANHRYDDEIEFIAIPKRKSRWNRFDTLVSLYRRAKEVNAAIYQCEEIDSWLTGYLVARKSNARLVFDSHEFNPAEVAGDAHYAIKAILWLASICLEKYLVGKTDLVIVANDIVRSYYLILNRFSNVIKLENVPVLEIFKENAHLARNCLMLCHEGNLNFNRGLKGIVILMDRLKNAGVNSKMRIVGDVYGKERMWLEDELKTRGLKDCFEITGWLTYPEVGNAINGCDIGVIAMQPVSGNMLSGHPNKLFNYMRYGLAVVSPDFPEIKSIIDEENCGVVYNSTDDDGLYNAVLELASCLETRKKMGTNGRNAVLREHNWEHMGKRLLEEYKKIVQ